MSPNLDEQYEQVVHYLDGYRDFIRRLLKGSSREPRRLGLYRPRSFRFVTRTLWQLARRDALSEKTPAARVEFYRSVTSPEDQSHEYFEVATSDYTMDALSAHLIAAHPDYDFEALAKVHELRNERLVQYGPKEVFGLFLSVLALLLKSVPRSVVEVDLGASYPAFERRAFWLTLMAAAYFTLFLAPAWVQRWLASDRRNEVARLLRYTALKAKLTGTALEEQPDADSNGRRDVGAAGSSPQPLSNEALQLSGPSGCAGAALGPVVCGRPRALTTRS